MNKGAILLFLSLVLSGCMIRTGVEETKTQEERDAETTSQSIAQARATLEFIKLCDTNGGIRKFTNHESCGRYCAKPHIVCNNGLEGWMK